MEIGNITRLKSKVEDLDQSVIRDLQEKVSRVMTRMFTLPENGGNPFLYAVCAPKEHYLSTELGTAWTDGKKYGWNPTFMASLSDENLAAIMAHESYHILFFHCTKARRIGKEKYYFNVSADFIVNGTIENEFERAEQARTSKNKGKFPKPLWGEPGKDGLHEPVSLKQYLDWIDGNGLDIPEKLIFTDKETYKRSPESVYNEIMHHVENSPRKCKACGALSLDPVTGESTIEKPWDIDACPMCGANPNYGSGHEGFDSHVDPAVTSDEVMSEMMKASDMVRATGRGTVPDSIESLLAELKKPTLSASDLIRNAFAEKAISIGDKKDWSRFERRPQAIWKKDDAGKHQPVHKIYRPKRYDFTPKWACLLDTSGSMHDQDIANGLKEVQPIAEMPGAEGWVVPVDAKPNWDKMTRITSKEEVRRTQVVGRGGTVFNDFFADYKKHVGDVDVVVVITDGYCGDIPDELKPTCDVVWIITSKMEFKPPFGRAIFIEPWSQ